MKLSAPLTLAFLLGSLSSPPSAMAKVATTAAATRVGRPPVVPPQPQKIKAKLKDICRVQLKDGNLVVESSLPGGTPRNGQLELEGMQGTGYYSAGPNFFQISYNGRRGNGYQNTSISQMQNRVTISRNEGDNLSQLNASLQQVGTGKNDTNVTLSVNESSAQTGMLIRQASYTARSITELRAANPQEFKELLGPIFRDLGLRGLDVDPGMVREVLVETPVPADLLERVSRFVAQLDADEFAQRDAAAAELRKLGHPGAAALKKLDVSKLTLQQRLMVPQIIAESCRVTPEEIARLRKDRDFLLDALYCDEENLRTLALERLGQVLGRKVDFDVKANLEKRAEAIEKLRS